MSEHFFSTQMKWRKEQRSNALDVERLPPCRPERNWQVHLDAVRHRLWALKLLFSKGPRPFYQNGPRGNANWPASHPAVPALVTFRLQQAASLPSSSHRPHTGTEFIEGRWVASGRVTGESGGGKANGGKEHGGGTDGNVPSSSTFPWCERWVILWWPSETIMGAGISTPNFAGR